MSLIKSSHFEIGKKAPDFELFNTVTLQMDSLNKLKGKKGTAILFICNHCPFVVHINKELIKLANDYKEQKINFIAISSNDVNFYPQDSPELMKQVATDLEYPFPYLYDKSQDVAKAYNAVCTPDLYLFDKNLKNVYHGQLDDSRPGNGIPLTGKDFRNAIKNLLKKTKNATFQKPSIGCSIKWI